MKSSFQSSSHHPARRPNLLHPLIQSIVVSLCLLVVLPILVSCDSSSKGADKGETIQIWQGFKDEEVTLFNQSMKDFQTEYRTRTGKELTLRLDRVSYDDMVTKLKSAALAKITPDIAFVDAIKVTDLAFGQALTPINEIPGFRYESIAKAREQFVEASFDSGVVNRLGEVKLYALPVQTTCVALFWNRAKFRSKAAQLTALHLDPNRPPKTWDELISYGKVLSEPERGIYGYGMQSTLWFNFPIYNMYGVDFVSYDKQGRASPALNSVRTKAAIECVKKVAESGAEGGAWKRSALSPENGFINEKYAMIISGPWMAEKFAAAGLDYDIALVPTPSQEEIQSLGIQSPSPELLQRLGPMAYSSSNVGGQGGVILKSCKNPQLAYEILEYFTSEKVQRRWASQLGQIPVRKSAWPNLDMSKFPFIVKFMDQLSVARRVPQIPLYGILESDVVNPEFNLFLQGSIPPEKFVENVEKNMKEKILNKINEAIGNPQTAKLE